MNSSSEVYSHFMKSSKGILISWAKAAEVGLKATSPPPTWRCFSVQDGLTYKKGYFLSFSFEDYEYNYFSGVLSEPSEPKLIHIIPLKGTKGGGIYALLFIRIARALFLFFN